MTTKHQILAQYPELELTPYGDFMVKQEFIEQYEIIDFHTHCLTSVASMVPKPFRKAKSNFVNSSFFDLSCYPGKIQNFDFERVAYRTWPQTTYSKYGLKTLAELFALSGVIPLLQNATIERANRDMKQNGISKMVLLPIQGENGAETEDLIEQTRDYSDLLFFGSIHPNEQNIQEKIDKYISRGIKGFKIAPHVWNIDADDKRVINLLGYLNDTKLPVITCSGLAIPNSFKHLPKSLIKSMNTQSISRFIPVLKKLPDINLIFAHAGLEQNDELIELMKQYPSINADVSTQTAENIKKMITKLGTHRLLFGSDYPFFNQAFPILSVLKASQSDDERQKIFSGNAKRILSL
ncbi:MAG TPA: amidohydrolase family protein [Tangfeifania sp.]|nr:amidohydrolase family protein [Tangfeifania sp.]